MSPPDHPIRVLLVSADKRLLKELGDALKAPAFQVAAAVTSARMATQQAQEGQPDVAVIDAALPNSEGFAAVQDMMAFRPTPILVLAPSVSSPEAFQALALGALDVMARPSGKNAAFAVELDHRLRLLSGVRVIQHVRGRRRKRGFAAHGGPPVIGIAASLGGPRALAILLKGLPRDLPAPLCLVQHISEGFVGGLAAWLASESGMPVREAQDGEVLTPGVVLVAPSGRHLTVGEEDHVCLDDGPAEEGFKPSGTRLLRSLAERYGPRAIGVVLTGMGRDGAEGLSAIRAAGGHTLAQDEASATVYGMPRAAAEAGAVERVVNIEDMAAALVSLVKDPGGEGK